MESAVALSSAVSVEAHHGIGVGSIFLLCTGIDAICTTCVILAAEQHLSTALFEQLLDFLRHQPIELVLREAVVGSGAGGITRLLATTTVSDHQVSRWWGAGVPRVEVDDLAGYSAGAVGTRSSAISLLLWRVARSDCVGVSRIRHCKLLIRRSGVRHLHGLFFSCQGRLSFRRGSLLSASCSGSLRVDGAGHKTGRHDCRGRQDHS